MGTLITLIVSGLAEGALIFLMASGLSIILGMMGVINFAHGTLFLWGGYAYMFSYYSIRARVILSVFPDAFQTGTQGGILRVTGVQLQAGQYLPFSQELLIFVVSILIAVSVVFIMGIIFEKLFISRVYGNAPAQILITLGLQVVFTDLVRVIWGPNMIPMSRPPFLDGVSSFAGGRIAHYNVFLIIVGATVAIIIHRVITKTRIGMVIRAGLQSPENVQALGINIRKYFTVIFACGAALAGLGGALYMPLVGNVVSSAGMNNQILAFIVVVIGGLGNFMGSFLGSIFLGLMGVGVAVFLPAISVVANVLVMAIVLVFRPDGLFGKAVNKS